MFIQLGSREYESKTKNKKEIDIVRKIIIILALLIAMIFEVVAASQGAGLLGGGNQIIMQNANPDWVVP